MELERRGSEEKHKRLSDNDLMFKWIGRRENSRVILAFSGKFPSLKSSIREKVLLTGKFNFRQVDFKVLGEYPWGMAMSIRQLGKHG